MPRGPEMSLTLSSLLLGMAVASLLWAELRNSQAGVWIAKPIASAIFVATALLAGALDSTFGLLILMALLLSWLGDVLLIPQRQNLFVAGLASFLLAHLAFSAAFFQHSLDTMYLLIAAIVMLVVAVLVMRWLWPFLPIGLRVAVVAYMAAISLMVVLAVGAMADYGPHIVIGAVLFAISDLFVARERFVVESVTNRLVGLPLYYGAQLILALSITGPYRPG